MVQFNEHSANFSNSCADTIADYLNNHKVGISSAAALVEIAKLIRSGEFTKKCSLVAKKVVSRYTLLAAQK